VLYEEEQLLPDGRARKRNVPVSEKLIGDEDWGAAISRAVQEELGSALDPGPPQVGPGGKGGGAASDAGSVGRSARRGAANGEKHTQKASTCVTMLQQCLGSWSGPPTVPSSRAQQNTGA
jgi:hypothetical protein